MHISSEQLLRFLCIAVHPAVSPTRRRPSGRSSSSTGTFGPTAFSSNSRGNSGRPIYGARSMTTGVAAVAHTFATPTEPVDAGNIARQPRGWRRRSMENPTLPGHGQLGAMFTRAGRDLRRAQALSDDIIAAAALIRRLFGNLGCIVQAPLSEPAVTTPGHGASTTSGGLSARHAASLRVPLRRSAPRTSSSVPFGCSTESVHLRRAPLHRHVSERGDRFDIDRSRVPLAN